LTIANKELEMFINVKVTDEEKNTFVGQLGCFEFVQVNDDGSAMYEIPEDSYDYIDNDNKARDMFERLLDSTSNVIEYAWV
jgi:hypothetical protein